MKILITKSTLADERWHPILDLVLIFVEDQRHSIDLECLDVLFASKWLNDRGKSNRDLISLSVRRASHDRLADKVSLSIDAAHPRGNHALESNFAVRMHPLDALNALSRPFVIIVENELFDGSFLLWMARALEFDRFIKAYREGRLVFRHAGGKDWFTRSVEVLCRGVWPRANDSRTPVARLCSCVLLDNDSRYPGHSPNARIVDDVKPYVAFIHQLSRRSIESYIPYATLLRFDRSPAFKLKIDALFRLSGEQRKYYNMKTGFRYGDELLPTKAGYMSAAAQEVADSEKQLFAEVSDDDWQALAAGFGRKLASIFVDHDYRPSAVDAKAVDAEARQELMSFLEAAYERI